MAPKPIVFPPVSTPTGHRAIYYHTEWSIYGRAYFVKDLPVDGIVDIVYAFLNVDSSGNVAVGDEWASYQNPHTSPPGVDVQPPANSWDSPPQNCGQLGQFKKLIVDQGKRFNLSIAIGGWSYSAHFSDAVSTAQNRTNFINSLSTFLDKYPGIFNGISIDWEYLSDDGVNYGKEGNVARPEDADNCILLLQQLREAFPDYLIAFCCVAAPEKAQWPVQKIIPLLDELHVMTYDFHDGNWGEKVTAHHANLLPSPAGKWSVDEAVKFYLAKDVPPSKLFIGGALYSRGFNNTDGINKPADGASPHASFPDGDPGVVLYKQLPFTGDGNNDGVVKWDDEAKAAYVHYPTQRVVDTYDNVQSVTAKADYIKKNKLGGIILWESAGDFPYTDDRSIMKTLHHQLTHSS